jgi:hypothetical protein
MRLSYSLAKFLYLLAVCDIGVIVETFIIDQIINKPKNHPNKFIKASYRF